MAYPGYIDRTVYTIIVKPADLIVMKNRRQVKVEGTHLYLHYIVPNPINKTRGKRTLSYFKHEKKVLKKKTNIHVNMEDLITLEFGTPVQIGCFKLMYE